MAIGTLQRRLLVDDDRFVCDHARLRVTFVTWNARMPSLQREVRARIMIER